MSAKKAAAPRAETASDATLMRSLNLLEREGVIERASHPDGRIKAMRLTSKGRRSADESRHRRKPKKCLGRWTTLTTRRVR